MTDGENFHLQLYNIKKINKYPQSLYVGHTHARKNFKFKYTRDLVKHIMGKRKHRRA